MYHVYTCRTPINVLLIHPFCLFLLRFLLQQLVFRLIRLFVHLPTYPLVQVEHRLGELNKEISSTRKELTRKS